MDAELDPAADFLWDSVASISRYDGIEERRPRNEADWQEVRRHALRLLEATNLLVIEGRRVSRTYMPASADGDLDSDAMQAKIDANRPAFVGFAHGVHAAGMQLLDAIDARDADALFDRGSQLDQACENCHLTFWFPKRPAPAL
jgi:hypothetical protein